MVGLHRRLSVSEQGKRALLLGAGASLLYSALVFAYSLAPGSNVSISGTLWHAVVLSSVLALGTIGVPVFLWYRYRLRSPAVLLVVVLLFWHVIVYMPPFGDGDSPGFLFVFMGVPFYLVAYGLVAGGEYWLRGRNRSRSPPSA
ncbi:hypothetical protein [Candidatus Halobonum tyrrellensis]|uniref:Uncharacterized protein n=1 Tax=Candidatus Halobonum tyrrellensis G22 TaxID=1324957 RepID=V4HGE8_9EURY|nr:hypothetical protein [Candidatus Halobonum tyrrellensis]ESP86869.1 hypothetical protein K933_17337 [Candidatus Halobonum tyrrellensis G22]